MSAPMSNRLPTKETFNSLIRSHIILSFCLILTIVLSITNESVFSLIKYKLTLTKLFIFIVAAFNIILYRFILPYECSSQKQFGVFAKVRAVLKNGFLLFCSCLFFHVIAVLFGAPFLESTAETFHFGMIMSVTVTLPLLCVFGTNTSGWIRVFAQNSPELGAESVVYFSTICSIFGAWLGAFPIPLDWDRPWQEWPITCVVGSLLGYCIGVIIGTVYLYGNCQKIKKSQKLT